MAAEIENKNIVIMNIEDLQCVLYGYKSLKIISDAWNVYSYTIA